MLTITTLERVSIVGFEYVNVSWGLLVKICMMNKTESHKLTIIIFKSFKIFFDVLFRLGYNNLF